MELRDPNKPSIDPRRLVRDEGTHALANILAATGYIPQSHTLSDVALALRQYHPILFGGPRGSGKTSLGEALAQACNLTLFYVPGVEGLTAGEVLGSWRVRAQEQAIEQLIHSGTDPRQHDRLCGRKSSLNEENFLMPLLMPAKPLNAMNRRQC